MQWQRDWLAALYDGTTPALGGLAGPFSGPRFAIYQASLIANMGDALRDTYPVVDRLVGEGFFTHAARGFIAAHPSKSGDIHDYGTAFADYLAGLQQASGLSYLPDVARLEWLAHEAFHAAEGAALSLATLATLPSALYCGLRLLPSVRLLRSDYPVHRIWQVNQPDWAGSHAVDLGEGGVNLAIHREGLQIVLLPLRHEAYTLARALADGLGMESACEALLGAYPEADPGHALHSLIMFGLIADIACHHLTP